MGLFDAPSFLAQSFEAENATRRDPLPIGETFGQIEKIEVADGVAGPNAKTPGKMWVKLNAFIKIADSAYLEKAGKEAATIIYGIMLDMNETGTAIAYGPDKNVKLGKLREATGTNTAGKSWNDMPGQFIKFTVTHRPDDKDPSIVYDEVGAVAKMS